MRIIILLLALLNIPYLAVATESKETAQVMPSIRVGMSRSAVDSILENSKWKKLDEKTTSNKQSRKTITYRFGSRSLTYLESKIVLTYTDDKLISIDQYDLNDKPLKRGLEQVYVW